MQNFKHFYKILNVTESKDFGTKIVIRSVTKIVKKGFFKRPKHFITDLVYWKPLIWNIPHLKYVLTKNELIDNKRPTYVGIWILVHEDFKSLKDPIKLCKKITDEKIIFGLNKIFANYKYLLSSYLIKTLNINNQN